MIKTLYLQSTKVCKCTKKSTDMEMKRDSLLSRLMGLRHNGMIKVITGMRRCGKSYLLFNLFSDSLKAEDRVKDRLAPEQNLSSDLSRARDQLVNMPVKQLMAETFGEEGARELLSVL